MQKGPLLPDQFVPTQFSTALDKANFGNMLLHFIESGFKQSLFTKSFYSRLSMCFSHIAHYDQISFYAAWFATEADCLRFLRHTLQFPCHGDPAFTFSDVEIAIQQEIVQRNYVARWELRVAETLRSDELKTLVQLEAKYRHAIPQNAQPIPERTLAVASDFAAVASPAEPVQANLFECQRKGNSNGLSRVLRR